MDLNSNTLPEYEDKRDYIGISTLIVFLKLFYSFDYHFVVLFVEGK